MRRGAAFVPGLAAAAVLAFVVATRGLAGIPRTIAIAAIVASLAVAALARRPDVRAHASAILAVAAVTAAGQAQLGAGAGVLAAFALVVVVSLHAAAAPGAALGAALGAGAGPTRRGQRATPSSATAERTARARKTAGAVLAVVAAAVAGALVAGLPPLGAAIEQRIHAYIDAREADGPVGLSSRLVVGYLHPMLLRDRIVFRVYGASDAALLRGAVFDHYERREWWSSLDGRRSVVAAGASRGPGAGPGARAPAARIVVARGAVLARGAEARWFLPPNACDLRTGSGAVAVDAAGVAHPEPADDEEQIAFDERGCTPAAVAPPSAADLEMTPGVRRHVTPFGRAWTAGAATDEEKLRAIERALGRFRYAMKVDWDYRVDPVVDFLEDKHAGHCELFASAMVLTARSVGIPARLVTGYRVSEHVAGHAVVRDRDAHAWVEAWQDGAWHAWDPTPASELLAPRRPSALGEAWEAMNALLDRALAEIGVQGLLGVAAAIAAVVWGTIRYLLPLLRRRARRGALAAWAAALPSFVSLERALARAGHARDPAEPLERFARRVREAGEPWSDAAANAIAGYAALRYGDVGDEREVTRAVDRAAALVPRA